MINKVEHPIGFQDDVVVYDAYIRKNFHMGPSAIDNLFSYWGLRRNKKEFRSYSILGL